MTNNPFIDQSSSAYSRFPDISQSPTRSPYTSWTQPSTSGSNFSAYPQAGQQTGFVPPYQQAPPSLGPPQAWAYPNNGYAPTSPAPQHQQMTGLPFSPGPNNYQPQQQMGYGGAAQQPQPQFTGYPGPSYDSYQQGYGNAPQQPQQPNNAYLAEFDPYSDVGQQGWQNQNPSPTPKSPSHTRSTSSSSSSGWNRSHPREYIRQHKAELEIWDPYAWKQLENACDALKDAWAERKAELEARITQLGYGGNAGWYGVDQERSRLQDLLKEADSHYGAIAASTFQLKEVFAGYRQSSDLASKRRVREAVNAAVQTMPDWPSKVY